MNKESAEDKETAYQMFLDALYPVRQKGKWGYINRKGDMVIPPAFAAAEDFHQGMAVAARDENQEWQYGYIDTKGKWIIAPAYTRARPFYENRAAVKNDKGYGYIDANGKEVIPIQFEAAGNFSEGIAAVKINGWTGFIDTSGHMMIEPKFICSVDHPLFSEGMAPVFGADEMTGFINPQGAWVIEPRFHSASRFSEDKAWAMTKEEDAETPYGFRIRGGYIDRTGEFVIEPQYDFGWDFSEGHATVWKISDDRKTKLWFVLDPTGNIVLSDLTYRNVGAMRNGWIPVQNEEMKWGFIDLSGKEVIKPQYTGVNHFRNGLARMEVGSAFDPEPVYINTKGEVLWKE